MSLVPLPSVQFHNEGNYFQFRSSSPSQAPFTVSWETIQLFERIGECFSENNAVDADMLARVCEDNLKMIVSFSPLTEHKLGGLILNVNREARNSESVAKPSWGLERARVALICGILPDSATWTKFLDTSNLHFRNLMGWLYDEDEDGREEGETKFDWNKSKEWMGVCFVLVKSYLWAMRTSYRDVYQYFCKYNQSEAPLSIESFYPLTWKQLGDTFKASPSFLSTYFEVMTDEKTQDAIESARSNGVVYPEAALDWVASIAQLLALARCASEVEVGLTRHDMLTFHAQNFGVEKESLNYSPDQQDPSAVLSSLLNITQLMPYEMLLIKDPLSEHSQLLDMKVEAVSIDLAFCQVGPLRGLECWSDVIKIQALASASEYFDSVDKARE